MLNVYMPMILVHPLLNLIYWLLGREHKRQLGNTVFC